MAASAAVIAALRGVRLPCHDEKALQAAISDALAAAELAHEREVAVTGGFIDILSGDVAIEAKLAGSGRGIFRQLQGYAEDPRIAEFVLVTNKAVSMPPLIRSKPCFVVSVGRAWL